MEEADGHGGREERLDKTQQQAGGMKEERSHLKGEVEVMTRPDLKDAAFGLFPLAGIFTLPIGVLIGFQFARANLTHQIIENL